MWGDNMKKILTTLTIIMGIALVTMFIALGNHRAIKAEVIKIKDNIVTFKDTTDNLWEYETDVYSINDKVILTFNDKGTEFLTDDEIIKIQKVGE